MKSWQKLDNILKESENVYRILWIKKKNNYLKKNNPGYGTDI